MKKKFLLDISASTLQVLLNQLSGIIVFYITSKYLDKKDFGELNWSLAVLVTSFNVLGCGIDQITIKKVASEPNHSSLLSIYMGHVLFTGFLFYVILFICRLLFPHFFDNHNLLFLLTLSQLLTFISLPFKQLATGREQFRLLLFMSTCSNILKALGLLVGAILGYLTPLFVILVFTIGSGVELLLCIFLSKPFLKQSSIYNWNRTKYYNLIKESLPQLGSVIFNSAVARFDWIFLGLMATSVAMAEYSFAYKVFELATLPLIILSPLLLPRFTRFFQISGGNNLYKNEELIVLLRIEMIVSSFIFLMLNIMWSPVIDAITNNKYGASNIYNILLLSICMPFLYLNNFLWTINFARGKLSLIFGIITVTFLINVIGDIVLIPFLQGLGAAIAYLLAIVVQAIIYTRSTSTHSEILQKAWQSLCICIASAVICEFIVKWMFHDLWLQIVASIGFYSILLLVCRQIRSNDLSIFKKTVGI
ncbi:MAG TPA: oligosaccharide flippase family protein [Puia sp.]|nr:oligosaccharide flippase family protein [Puia sp.]